MRAVEVEAQQTRAAQGCKTKPKEKGTSACHKEGGYHGIKGPLSAVRRPNSEKPAGDHRLMTSNPYTVPFRTESSFG